MFSFRFNDRMPPGGKFYYLVPETKVFLESYRSKNDLYDQVARHYGMNGIPVPGNLMALIEDHMCRDMPPGACLGDDGGRPVARRPMQFFRVVEKLEVFFRKPREFVDVVEAERRSEACFSCDCNWPGMCVSCNGLKQLILRLVRGRKVARDKFMGVCTKTEMPIGAMLFVKDPYFGTVDGYPQHCWARRKDTNASGI